MPTRIFLVLGVLPVLASTTGPSGFCKPLDFLLGNLQECLLSDRIPLSLPQSLPLEYPRSLCRRGKRSQYFAQETSSWLTPEHSANLLSNAHSANVSLRLMRQLYKPSENLVFSPYSIMTSLMMLLLGSNGQSRLQLLETLFGSTNDSFVQQFTSDYAQLIEINAEQLKMGNFLYPDTSFHLNAQYTERLARDFAAIVKEVSFANETSALQTINADVRKATQGMIDQLFDHLDSSTVLLLVNTVLFKGLWAVPFKETDTDLLGSFYRSSGEEVKVPMMKQIIMLPYFKEDGTEAVLVPFQDSFIVMLLLLPPKETPIDVFVNQINGTFLDKMIQETSNSMIRDIDLVLPRFKLSSTHTDLVSVLGNLGVTSIFSPSKDNLGGLAVSEMIQKATIEVNEEGTEAAAATAIRYYLSAFTFLPIQFTANRPFVYALINRPKLNEHKEILFMGVLQDPNKK